MATPAYLGQVGTFLEPTLLSTFNMTTTLAVGVGSTIFVPVRTGGSIYVTNVTDSAGNSYSLIARSTILNVVANVYATVVTSPLAVGQTITITTNTALQNCQANALAFSNVQLSGVTTTSQATATTSISVTSGTPQQYSGMFLCVGCTNYAGPPSLTAIGFTNLSLSGTQYMGVAWKSVSSITTETVTWSDATLGSRNWGATISVLNSTSGEFFNLF